MPTDNHQPAARRLHRPRMKTMGSVRLYRDDLERIIELFRAFPPDPESALPAPDLTFESDRHSASTLDALLTAEPGPHLRRLTILRPYEPRMELTLSALRTAVYVGSDRPEFRGPFEALVDLLKERRRRILTVAVYTSPFFMGVVGGAIVASGGRAEEHGLAVLTVMAGLAGLAVGSLGLLVGSLLLKRVSGFSIVYTTDHATTPGFWRRNGESLTVESLKYLGSGAVGWLLGRLG